ncbi:MAG: GNAT family N-acetyltransferase, partial [Limosilactobacillus sp.]|nr:GNAT family N-acetyltransferase [Limosilactobacillus sp.]
MHLEKAQLSDLDRVIEILKDGRNQLSESGIDQWQGDYPNREHVKEDIENGYAYLVHSDDHETVGTSEMVPGPDPLYDQLDGQRLLDTDAY